MNIRWITLFATVAEEGSFTRAAAVLNIAQPWLSAQIRKLEYELGVLLFDRVKAGVELTAEGRQLLPQARQVLLGTKNFRDLARTMGEARTRTVRIGSFLPMVDVETLNRLNTKFMGQHANFLIVGTTGVTSELIGELRAGQIDAAVCVGPLIDEDGGDLEQVMLQPIRPYLLGPAAEVRRARRSLEEMTLMAPPVANHSPVFGELVESLKARGATIRSAPELDKRAIEYQVRHHNALAVMISGAPQDYADDKQLDTEPVDIAPSHTILVRMKSQSPGRAAERYWTLALAATKHEAEAASLS